MVAVRLTLPAPPQLQGRWAALLEEAGLRPQILALADKFPEQRSLEIPFATIDAADTGLADLLLERPEEVMDAGRKAMRDLLPVAGPEADGLRLRPVGLPPTSHRSIRNLREADLNRLVAIDGIDLHPDGVQQSEGRCLRADEDLGPHAHPDGMRNEDFGDDRLAEAVIALIGYDTHDAQPRCPIEALGRGPAMGGAERPRGFDSEYP